MSDVMQVGEQDHLSCLQACSERHSIMGYFHIRQHKCIPGYTVCHAACFNLKFSNLGLHGEQGCI